jgi:hypothetical protein
LKEVILEMAAKRLGLACVIDGDGRLQQGITTDADCNGTWNKHSTCYVGRRES